jgi:hypothetical protein
MTIAATMPAKILMFIQFVQLGAAGLKPAPAKSPFSIRRRTESLDWPSSDGNVDRIAVGIMDAGLGLVGSILDVRRRPELFA